MTQGGAARLRRYAYPGLCYVTASRLPEMRNFKTHASDWYQTDAQSRLTLDKETPMRSLRLLALLLSLTTPAVCRAQAALGKDVEVRFATVKEAQRILTDRDDFVRSMSPFDRAARLKTDKDVSETEYLAFVSNEVLEWSDAERRKITAAFQVLATRFQAFGLPFPKPVFLVKTTGNEEGQSAYTRANAVVLPRTFLRSSETSLQETICHELFHVLSRANPKLRDDLYATIGFLKCEDVEFPPSLKTRKITNPDAPRNDHYIRIQVNGKAACGIPLLFSKEEKYNTARGGEFFEQLQFQLLLVEPAANSPAVEPISEGQHPKLVALDQASGFMEQVGRNTGYLIHPEEILADNFMMMILSKRNARSPEIIERLERILKQKPTAQPIPQRVSAEE